jgi:hypothetical protein
LLRGRPTIIWKAYYEPGWPNYLATPGQIVGYISGEGAVVKTGDSTLLIREIQSEQGAVEMPRWPIGTRLGLNPFDSLQTMQQRIEGLERALTKGKKVP